MDEITIVTALNSYDGLYFEGLDEIEQLVKRKKHLKTYFLLVSKILNVGKVPISFDIDVLNLAGC